MQENPVTTKPLTIHPLNNFILGLFTIFISPLIIACAIPCMIYYGIVSIGEYCWRKQDD